MSGKIISLFSGAMGLDLGLESVGLETGVCVEWDKHCAETIRSNRPQLPLIQADISTVPSPDILSAASLSVGEALAVVGGPPCQPFSSGGLRQTIRERRGSLYAEFVRVVEETRPRYFAFENVSQILSAAIRHRPIKDRPGQNWNLSAYSRSNGSGETSLAPEEQAGSALDVILDAFDSLGYSLAFGLLNAADYGAPQRRLRFVVLGSRDHPAGELPRPTHSRDAQDGRRPWATLRDALGGLEEDDPEHSEYGERFTEYFRQIPPGGNWRSLPDEVQMEAMGEKSYHAGGGKTGFFRRLDWDAPTPTIVGKPNRKSSAICHPEVIRPLTVRECARVQGFPDDWKFSGSMHPKYLQIGNAVPVQLGAAIGAALKEWASGHSTNEVFDATAMHGWRTRRDEMLEQAREVFRDASRNNRAKRKKRNPDQTTLF